MKATDLPEPEEMARLNAIFDAAEAAGETLYEFHRDAGVYVVAYKSDVDAAHGARLNPGTLKVVNIRTAATIWSLHSPS